MKDSVDVKGFVTFNVYDQNGRFVRSINDQNLITSAGKNFFVRRIIGGSSISSIAISDIAVGDGTTAATESDTSLENEVARVEIDSIFDNNNVGTFLTSLEIGVATGTISEAGLYTNESIPTLISRIVLDTPFTKEETETIQVEWRFKIGGTSSSTLTYIQSGYVQDGYV